MSSWLRRFAETAWIAVALSALAITFPRAAPLILPAAVLLCLLLPRFVRVRRGHPRLFRAAAALLLLACGATVFYQPGWSVDLQSRSRARAPDGRVSSASRRGRFSRPA
jgi:hypothetical protein